jgi:GT2 family glycosyltransferase
MSNPVLTLTHNGLEHTKKAIQSVFEQDIPTKMFVFDNGSTDGTIEWLRSAGDRDNIIYMDCKPENLGVSRGWNEGLTELFRKFEHVLVINNDVVLPAWFYGELLAYDVPFVTGVSVDDITRIVDPPPEEPLQPAPDFSGFLIRREAWIKVGPFDEAMRLYASDADYHIRACQAGIPLMKANVPFYHERSSTLRNASPEERQQINQQADSDRTVFLNKWGFKVGSPEHHRAVGFEYSPKAPKILFPGTHG